MSGTDPLDAFITQMPKVELHVHLEGSVRPATLLHLAERHDVPLPAADLAGIQEWYTFRDFDHFVQIYLTISRCLRTAADIELIAREFLIGQAEQNIRYSEVTFTPYNQFLTNELDFHTQIDAVNRARAWAAETLGVRMALIMDIPRLIAPEKGDLIADWAISRFGDGVDAFGLGGPEVGNPPEKFQTAFDKVRAAGIPCILHAGEHVGPSSIWSALNVAGSRRLGHGVRAIEDPDLIAHLVEHQIPLEVCPSSNVCLGVYPSLAEHSLPQLLAAGLCVTLNSDDPPMFNTTLTDEYLRCRRQFNWDRDMVERLMLNAVAVTLLPAAERQAMRAAFAAEFSELW